MLKNIEIYNVTVVRKLTVPEPGNEDYKPGEHDIQNQADIAFYGDGEPGKRQPVRLSDFEAAVEATFKELDATTDIFPAGSVFSDTRLLGVTYKTTASMAI